MPFENPTYCSIRILVVFGSALCGVLIILAMTFDRFYGIIRPHKASSFNTVKRAKITCLIIIIFSTLYNVPHIFLTLERGYDCVPYGRGIMYAYGEVYYWSSFVLNFSFPFVALLIMNSFIIHTIRSRRSLTGLTTQSQRSDKGTKPKSSDSQVFAILLLVTFSFLFLTTPTYMLFLFQMIMDFTKTPELFAGWHIFFGLAQKLFFTNNGINFFLYILSGTKFRNDFRQLICCGNTGKTKEVVSGNTVSTSGGWQSETAMTEN